MSVKENRLRQQAVDREDCHSIADPKFITCLFDKDDLLEARLLPCKEQHYVQAKHIDEINETLRKANTDGQGIYVGANPRKRKGGKADDVALARCLFVDIDDEEPYAALRRIKDVGLPTSTCAVSSGHGLHAYWRLDVPMIDLAVWPEAQAELIALLGADPRIKDLSRVMRLPGFKNHKPPTAPCQIISADPNLRYRLDQILPDFQGSPSGNSLSALEPKATVAELSENQSIREMTSKSSVLSNISATPEEIIEMTQPVKERERNECVFNLARGLKYDAGLGSKTLSKIRPLVHRWHDLAKPVIRTKPFDDTWSDFVQAWECADFPLCADLVSEAFSEAHRLIAEGRLPKIAYQYDSAPVQILVGVCAVLGNWRASGRFFLSSHHAAKYLDGVAPGQALRYLRMLCADEVLILLDRGNQHRAGRYRLNHQHFSNGIELEMPDGGGNSLDNAQGMA